MNWRRGFFRIALIVSIFLLILGVIYTWKTFLTPYNNYMLEKAIIDSRATNPIPKGSFDPDKYLGISNTQDSASMLKWHDEAIGKMKIGSEMSIILGVFPWVLYWSFGFIARGFISKRAPGTSF